MYLLLCFASCFLEFNGNLKLNKYKRSLLKHHVKNTQKLYKELQEKYIPGENESFYPNLSFTPKEGTKGGKKQQTSIGLTQLLPGVKQEHSPRTLILGSAGTGKSIAAQSIAYKWAKRELWYDRFDFIFYLNCEQLTKDMSDQKNWSLEELILKYHCPDKIKGHESELVKYLCDKEHKILTIIDGLDELTSWDNAKTVLVTSISQKSTIPSIIYNLVYGDLVRDMTVLVTSRPHPFLNDKISKFQSVWRAIGFDEDAIDTCSFAICRHDRKLHTQYRRFVKYKTQLHAHCSIPLNCFLTAAIISRDFQRCKEPSKMITIDRLSRLYIRLILDIVHKNKDVKKAFEEVTEDEKKTILSLASLAAEAVISEEQKSTFTEFDLIKNNISATKTNAIVNGLLEISYEPTGPAILNLRKTTASFTNRSVKEFLAAVHLCLNWYGEDVKKIAIVDPVNRKFDNIQLFTAGLLGDKEMGQKFLTVLKPGSSILQKVAQWFSSLFKKEGYQSSEFVGSMQTANTKRNLSKLAKLQMMCCGMEGNMSVVMQDVAKAVLTENVLDLGNVEGGLLPQHLVSVANFVEKADRVNGLE